MSAALLAYLAARKRHKAAKKRRDIDAVIDALKDDEDREDDRLAAAQTADAQAEVKRMREATRQRVRARESFAGRWIRRTLEFLNLTGLQFTQYLVMLYVFQSLSGTIRTQNEFYFDMFISSQAVANTYDHRHYSLRKAQTYGDIYKWMENALTPVLFHNAAEGQAWPDGDGLFSQTGATAYSTHDMVDEANIFGKPQGIVFKQLRMHAIDGASCYANHSCYAQLDGLDEPGDRTPFGRSNGETNMSSGHFKWWSREELGANLGGVASASHISGRLYSSSGFIAAFRPFFSDTYLPPEEGETPKAVIDFRPFEATASNGRTATYSCARYTTNGNHTVQRCDPGHDASTGVTRAMFDELIRYLKRGHWIDRQTALVSVNMNGENSGTGIRFSCRYLFEFSPLGGAVLPSYDTETLINHPEMLQQREMWLDFCLILIGWFTFLEIVEIVQSIVEGGSSGLREYLTSLWNVLDWINFGLYYYVYILCKQERWLVQRDQAGSSCNSQLCADFGYFDAWEAFAIARVSKMLFSFCVCIQLLKIIKFTNMLIPKMSLMTRVLTKASGDLIFFACIFGVSMFAFCMLFYLQLGSSVDNYYSQVYSMISLTRSLFGDFDIEEINENSKDYLNGSLFLVYLFVSVFILLALFLSILGEAQSAVRDDEIEARNDPSVEEPNEFGFLGDLKELSLMAVAWVLGKCGKGGGLADAELATPPESTIDSAKRERMLLVKSLKAFKPDFLTMIDSKLGAFEDKFNKKLRGIEAAIEDMEREQHRASGHRDASFKLKGNCADNAKSSGTGREKAALARSRTAGAAQAGSRGRSTGKKGAPSKSAPPSKHRSKRSVADATIAC